MLKFIKSFFMSEQIISNLHIIDDREDKYSLVPNVRLFIPCGRCRRSRHINIKCCQKTSGPFHLSKVLQYLRTEGYASLTELVGRYGPLVHHVLVDLVKWTD